MVLFSFGFASFVFSALPMDVARTTIRKAFPHFYSFVMGLAVIACLTLWSRDLLSAVLMAIIAVTTLFARQVLMPAINEATDSAARAKFKWLHGFSVVLTLGHIAITGFVLARFI
jgi:hypothetical protein